MWLKHTRVCSETMIAVHYYSYVHWIIFGVRKKANFNDNIRRQQSGECSYLILLLKSASANARWYEFLCICICLMIFAILFLAQKLDQLH